MDIRLKSLNIFNFKGIKALPVPLDGKDATICGANATGKTTVYDAFLWLLFGKDSAGAAGFSVKPIDANGNEIHNLSTSVSATISIDGTDRTLARTLEENWVKQRGRAEATFGGNVTTFEIDGVPKKAKEYSEFINSLVDEATFRLITNPMAFNAMKWQDRRAMLIKLSGEQKPIDDAKYGEIIEQIRSVGPEELRKSLTATRKKLNQELDQIPARVDEVNALIPDISPDQVKELRFLLSDVCEDIERVKTMVSDSDKVKRDAREELEHVISRIRASEADRARQEAAEMYAAKSLETRMAHARQALRGAQERLTDATEKCTSLRSEWASAKESRYEEPEISETCPLCGQTLPQDQIEQARQKSRERWDSDKQRRMSEIQASGKRAHADMDRFAQECEQLTAELKELEATTVQHPEPAEDPTEALRAREAELKRILDAPEADNVEAFRKRLDSLRARENTYRMELARADMREDYQRRLDELVERQQELGRLVAETDLHIMLTEEYIAESCRRVEQSVERLFPTVRWKLFDTQINGGIADTCICLIGGVPWSDANNAARINAGLEIINVLSTSANASAPIFVDNAEAVNSVASTIGQQIKLIVTTDEKLVVNLKGE